MTRRAVSNAVAGGVWLALSLAGAIALLLPLVLYRWVALRAAGVSMSDAPVIVTGIVLALQFAWTATMLALAADMYQRRNQPTYEDPTTDYHNWRKQ